MQKIKFSRTELKNRAATALLTAAPLSVMLLSAIYNLAFGSFGYDITSGIPVLLSCLTVIALIAGTVLAAVYKKRFPAVFFALLFLMCFICYACFCASGTTDIYADGFFEALMLILSVPVWSYMPLAARDYVADRSSGYDNNRSHRAVKRRCRTVADAFRAEGKQCLTG